MIRKIPKPLNPLNIKAVSTMEIADELGVLHSAIMQKIEGYGTNPGIIPTLLEEQKDTSKYFVPTTFYGGNGRNYRCYLVTDPGRILLYNSFGKKRGIQLSIEILEEILDKGAIK